MSKRKSTFKSSPLVTLLAVVALLALLISGGKLKGIFPSSQNPDFTSSDAVHFIDVGQGLSVLLQSGEHGILIDAGEREYGTRVADYIEKAGVTTLDYVIASHPHSDHIGGIPDVLSRIKTKNVIMPKLSDSLTPTTKCYERLLTSVADSKAKAIRAKAGSVYTVGSITLTVLAPVTQINDLNNMSVVCRAEIKNSSFMLLADAEKKELETVLLKGAVLDSDVLQMGHHGSSTSIYNSFLSAVDPDDAVISCGKNNSYGHPHKEALTYLQQNSIACYRTDTDGTVVFYCGDDGYCVRKEL